MTLEPVSRRYGESELKKAYREALKRVDLVVYWSWACFVVEYVGLFACYSLTWPRLTLYSGVSHAVGAVMSFWSQLDAWSFVASEWNFALFTILPCILEAAVTAFGMRAHWIELHAYTAAPKGTPPKMPPLKRILTLVFAFLFTVVGLPLTIRYVHRSLETRRLLEFSAWFGISIFVVAVLLCCSLVNYNLKLLGKDFLQAPVLHLDHHHDDPNISPFLAGKHTLSAMHPPLSPTTPSSNDDDKDDEEEDSPLRRRPGPQDEDEE